MNNPENRPLLVNGTETLSAGELHDMLMKYSQSGFMYPLCAELKYVAKFLLKQQGEIDTYKSQNGSQIDTYRYKELTDEEIKDFLATFPIIFTVDDLCTFARAILRKAQE